MEKTKNQNAIQILYPDDFADDKKYIWESLLDKLDLPIDTSEINVKISLMKY